MLQFKKATDRANSLKTIGTVAEFVGKDGNYELASEKNFKGTINAEGVKILKKVSIKVSSSDQPYSVPASSII